MIERILILGVLDGLGCALAFLIGDWLVGGWGPGGVLALVWQAVILVLMLTQERFVLGHFCRAGDLFEGRDAPMVQLIHKALRERQRRRPGVASAGLMPKLILLQDATPRLEIVGSWLGVGSIVLSQGMIHLLESQELLVLLQKTLDWWEQGGSALRTFCWMIVLRLKARLPSAWAKLNAGAALSQAEQGQFTVLGLLRFLMLLPWIRLFIWLGKPASLLEAEFLADPSSEPTDLKGKILSAVQISGTNAFSYARFPGGGGNSPPADPLDRPTLLF